MLSIIFVMVFKVLEHCSRIIFQLKYLDNFNILPEFYYSVILFLSISKRLKCVISTENSDSQNLQFV